MKNEKGFSLVELAVAATIATALAVVAVAVVSGTADGVSSDANAAAQAEDCYISSVVASNGESNSCQNNGGGGAGGSSGVLVIWDGSALSASINPAICNVSDNTVSYYYTNSGDGTVLMNSNENGSYVPSYSIGQNLGFGVTVISYHIIVNCDGTPTRSDNDIL